MAEWYTRNIEVVMSNDLGVRVSLIVHIKHDKGRNI